VLIEAAGGVAELLWT